MTKPSLQRIGILLSFDGSDTNLINYGISLAMAFKKDLCLIYAVKDSHKEQVANEDLQQYETAVKEQVPDLAITSASLKYRPGNFSRLLADDMEVILLITDVIRFSELAGPLRKSPVPFLFINGTSKAPRAFKKIIIPVDLRKQNKDSLLWSAYFGRHTGAEIIAIGASDKNRDNRVSVALHLNSIKKHFTRFDIPHKIYRGSCNSLSVQQEALNTAKSMNADMLIILGSSFITWLDRLIGLPEEKIIRHAGEIPVLVVNPKREIYLLCE